MNAVFDREPVKVIQCRGDVLPGFFMAEDSDC